MLFLFASSLNHRPLQHIFMSFSPEFVMVLPEYKNALLSENIVFGDESNRFVVPPQIHLRLTAQALSAAGRE